MFYHIHSVSFYSARLIDPILRTLLCGVLCVSAGFDFVVWSRCFAAADVVSSLLAQGLCHVISLHLVTAHAVPVLSRPESAYSLHPVFAIAPTHATSFAASILACRLYMYETTSTAQRWAGCWIAIDD